MNAQMLKDILAVGETVAVEFKRCGNGIARDTYESVCAFLNRFGGDVFLGVLDQGTVVGVPAQAAPDMIKNFISMIGNPDIFTPTIYLEPEIIQYEGHTIIHIHVPPSAEVHSYKRVIYDRVDDADVKVTATSQIAAMYIRKQNIFTEKKIYPFITTDDLRLDLLARVRRMAVNHAMGVHPWRDMDDIELLRSAGLYGMDHADGRRGYNLAAIMLLGRDEVIQDIAPSYVTDALLRKVNLDRYDDREIIKTNLVESYDLLMDFARKHLPDKFYLEDDNRVSLRNAIAREMLVNTLIHREMTSTFVAKFVIEKNRMYIENASRAARAGLVTPDNLEPNPKNPVIAAFFRQIGYSDQLGSGVRNLFRYTKLYSGEMPELIEGDIFRIIVPLDESYSFDAESGDEVIPDRVTPEKTTGKPEKLPETPEKTTGKTKKLPETPEKTTGKTPLKIPDGDASALKPTEKKLIEILLADPEMTQPQLAVRMGITADGVRHAMNRLKAKGLLKRVGSSRKGLWIVRID